MKKKIIIGLVLVVSLTAGYRIVRFIINKLSPAKKAQEVNAVPVKAVGVRLRDMANRVNLTGDIVGTEVVNVYSQVPGKVEQILIKEGDRVWKGQVLFRINRDIVGMEYNLAIVEAPISGHIGSITADRGMTVTVTTPLAQLVNMNTVEAVVKLIEEDVNRVKTGMAAEITVETFPGTVFRGTVYKKSAVLDQASRTQEARIRIHNPGLALKHGMFANASIIIGRVKSAVAVPVDAVRFDEKGNPFVYRVLEHKAALTRIKTGITVEHYTEVRSGLKEGDVVITLGHENAGDGDRLIVYREDVKQDHVNDKAPAKGEAKK